MGYSERRIELAKIAGYLHDIGNCVNRNDHAHSGAILSYEILKNIDIHSSMILIAIIQNTPALNSYKFLHNEGRKCGTRLKNTRKFSGFNVYECDKGHKKTEQTPISCAILQYNRKEGDLYI